MLPPVLSSVASPRNMAVSDSVWDAMKVLFPYLASPGPETRGNSILRFPSALSLPSTGSSLSLLVSGQFAVFWVTRCHCEACSGP